MFYPLQPSEISLYLSLQKKDAEYTIQQEHLLELLDEGKDSPYRDVYLHMRLHHPHMLEPWQEYFEKVVSSQCFSHLNELLII